MRTNGNGSVASQESLADLSPYRYNTRDGARTCAAASVLGGLGQRGFHDVSAAGSKRFRRRVVRGANRWHAVLCQALERIGPGVYELVDDHRGDTYRAVYTLRIAGNVHVLHAFQKKSKSGIKTPKPDFDLIERSLKALLARYGKRR
ncbi:MAG TPA: type II toxin-antitoxin system RelE/ParE family toxin [Stellaceae bacterium]|nr:type II toxin-antitoxin system RelE/ParE family toxin [Stellaceae bacterium]